ncbi:hypothetical protein cand_034130 [Cryptosporidium andersoni]|uniref:Chorein N-terminal domain-containing protein n=1 Tax=Cryptosporidium andersoni TaxID=117008 RepID=A0A1J4MXV1_9CRYT|nr:hypothetical protein cand_034130 [Cryptosporidium andersoni]
MKRAVSRVSSFVAKWATAFIGKYLENVSEDSFELGLNSGKLQLRGVKIKEGVIEQLKLPIKVIQGSIKTINISIPYGNILRSNSNAPLVIEIDELNLNATFLDEFEMNTSHIENLVTLSRLKLIEHWNLQLLTELAEEEFNAKGGVHKHENSQPFWRRIISRLIQDIRVHFRHIHVRLQSTTIQDKFFLGIILRSLEIRSIPQISDLIVKNQVLDTVESVDLHNSTEINLGPELLDCYQRQIDSSRELFTIDSENLNSIYFDYFFQFKNSSSYSYKLLELNGLTVYLHPDGTSDADISKSSGYSSICKPLIHPFCCKLLLRQYSDAFDNEKKPLYTICGILDEVTVTISKDIITHISFLLDYLQYFNNCMEFGKIRLERRYLYRPNVPIKGNARLWWKYAAGCILREDLNCLNHSSDSRCSAFLKVQDTYRDAKILMYCKDYSELFQKYFEESMNRCDITFNVSQFSTSLLEFSKQNCEYYCIRIPFNIFLNIHTSLVHKWVEEGFQKSSNIFLSKKECLENNQMGKIGWKQWLLSLHKLLSPSAVDSSEIFYDASEGKNFDNLNEKISQPNSNFHEENLQVVDATSSCTSIDIDSSSFYDCHSEETEQKSQSQLHIVSIFSSSPYIYTQSPFISIRIILKKMKLEILLTDDLDKPVSINSATLVGAIDNFGIDFLQSESNLSLMIVLQEFSLDYADKNDDIYHLIYPDNQSNKGIFNRWFTGCYVFRSNSLISGSSIRRRGASASTNSDAILETNNSVETVKSENKQSICLNVEKCCVNIYSNVIFSIYSWSQKLIKNKNYHWSQEVRIDKGQTEAENTRDNLKQNDQYKNSFIVDSELVEFDIYIATPILIFCYETELNESICGVVSFGKISVTNKRPWGKNCLEIDGLNTENAFDSQYLMNKEFPTFYRYFPTKSKVFWFKCINSQNYYIKVEDIYLCTYSNSYPIFYKYPKKGSIDEKSNQDFTDNCKVKCECSNNYTLFNIDCIDAKLYSLNYKKYNMFDETCIKYVKLFDALPNLDIFSNNLFNERSFINLALATNSSCLDVKSSDTYLNGELLDNIYISLKIESITLNFDLRVYNQLYTNFINLVKCAGIDIFDWPKNKIPIETSNINKFNKVYQLFWFVKLQNLVFDCALDTYFCLRLSGNSISMLNLNYDQNSIINIFVEKILGDCIISDDFEASSISLFVNSDVHVYTKVPLIKETDKNLIIKLDSKATKVHLRPTILQDLIEFVNKISQCKSFVSNLSKENQVSNPNLFSLEITFDEFGLISYQRNREFFEMNMTNIIRIRRSKESNIEINAITKSISCYFIYDHSNILIFEVSPEEFLDANLLLKIVLSEKVHLIKGYEIKTMYKIIFTSQIFVTANRVTVMLFFDKFLHSIFYFDNILENIQSITSNEISNSNSYISLKDIRLENCKVIIPASTDQEYASKEPKILLNIDHFHFHNKYNVFSKFCGENLLLYIFKFCGVNLYYFEGEDKNSVGSFNEIGTLPSLNFHIRRFQKTNKAYPFDLSCFFRSSEIAKLNFKPKYLSLLIGVFVQNIMYDDEDILELRRISRRTISDPYYNKNDEESNEYFPHLIKLKYFGNEAIECYKSRISSNYFIEDVNTQPTHAIHFFFPKLKIQLFHKVKEVELDKSGFKDFITLDFTELGIYINKYFTKNISVVNVCFLKFSLSNKRGLPLIEVNGAKDSQENYLNQLSSMVDDNSEFKIYSCAEYQDKYFPEIFKRTQYPFHLLKYSATNTENSSMLKLIDINLISPFINIDYKLEAFIEIYKYFCVFMETFEYQNTKFELFKKEKYKTKQENESDNKILLNKNFSIKLQQVNISYSNSDIVLILKGNYEISHLKLINDFIVENNTTNMNFEYKRQQSLTTETLASQSLNIFNTTRILENEESTTNLMVSESMLVLSTKEYYDLVFWKNFEGHLLYNISTIADENLIHTKKSKRSGKFITQPFVINFSCIHISLLYRLICSSYEVISKNIELYNSNTTLTDSYEDSGTSWNIIIYKSNIVLLNSVNNLCNIPLLKFHIQSYNFNYSVNLNKNSKIKLPIQHINNDAEITLWFLNPKHGYYEPIIEECSFILNVEKYSTDEIHSTKCNSTGRTLVKINAQFPTKTSFNISPIMFKTLLFHSKFLTENCFFVEYEKLINYKSYKITNNTGFDIHIFGYPNFEKFHEKSKREVKNNDQDMYLFSTVILNGEEKGLNQFDNCFHPLNIQLLGIDIGIFDKSKLKFNTLFRMGKAISIENPGNFIVPLISNKKESTNITLISSPYILCKVEYCGDSDIAVTKSLTLSSPIQLINDLNFTLDMIYCEMNFNDESIIAQKKYIIPAASALPLPTTTLPNSNIDILFGIHFEEDIESIENLDYSEYGILPIYNILNEIISEKKNQEPVLNLDKQFIHYVQYLECSSKNLNNSFVGFYATFESRLILSRNSYYYQYIVRFCPYLSIISTLPIELNYRIIGEESEDKGKQVILDSGNINYLEQKHLHVPIRNRINKLTNSVVYQFRLEMGVYKDINNKYKQSEFLMFWACSIDLISGIKVGYWSSRNTSSYQLSSGIGSIVAGKNPTGIFTIYNFLNFPKGYPMKWLIHSQNWLSIIGTEIRLSDIQLVNFAQLDSALEFVKVSDNWINSKENLFVKNSSIPQFSYPIIQKTGTIHITNPAITKCISNSLVVYIKNQKFTIDLNLEKDISNKIVKNFVIQDKLGSIPINIYYQEKNITIPYYNYNTSYIVGVLAIYSQSMVYNDTSMNIEILNSSFTLKLKPKTWFSYFPASIYKMTNLNSVDACRDYSELKSSTKILNLAVDSKVLFPFGLNKGQSWKILLDNKFSNFDEFSDNKKQFYLLVSSIYDNFLDLEILKISKCCIEEVNINNVSSPSLFIYNCSNKKVYITQRMNRVGDLQAFQQNTIREYIWFDYFSPRELIILSENSSLEGDINMANMKSPVNRRFIQMPLETSSFEVYDFVSSNKDKWLIYKWCRLEKDHWVFCIFSYTDFMDWFRLNGKIHYALSLLQPVKVPLKISSASSSSNIACIPSNSISLSLSRFTTITLDKYPIKYEINIFMRQIICSIVGLNTVSYPEELFLVVLDDVICNYDHGIKTGSQHLQLAVGNIQVDLQYKDSIYPVLLQRLPSSSSRTLNTLEQKFLTASQTLNISKLSSTNSSSSSSSSFEQDINNLPIVIISLSFRKDKIQPSDYKFKNNLFVPTPTQSLAESCLAEICDYIESSGYTNILLSKQKMNKIANSSKKYGSLPIIVIKDFSIRLMGINICFDAQFIYILTMINHYFDLFVNKAEIDEDRNSSDKNEGFPLLKRIYIRKFRIYPLVIHLTFNLDPLKSFSLSTEKDGNNSTLQINQALSSSSLNLSHSLEQFAHTFGLMLSSLIRSITTIEDAPLWLNQFELDESSYLLDIITKIRKHYEHELYNQLYVIATSLGSVGNPVNSFTNIGAGIGDLFYEPIYAVTSGRSEDGVVTGVKRGIESFMNHSVFGTFQAISKMAGTASQIAGVLTMDEKYIEERRRFVHGQQPRDLMDGLSIGAHAFGKSVTDGFSSLVGEVVEGATTGNPNSLALGLTKGLVAAVVKPITGVLDFTQKAAQGIQKASTVDRVGNTCQHRFTRAFYTNYGIIAPYSIEHAFVCNLLKRLYNFKSISSSNELNKINDFNECKVIGGLLYTSICGDGSKLAIVTSDSLLVLNFDSNIANNSTDENISVDHHILLDDIIYVLIGTLKIQSSSDSIYKGKFNETRGSVSGHGFTYNIEEIYPSPYSKSEEKNLNKLFNEKMISEIIIQMRRQKDIASSSSPPSAAINGICSMIIIVHPNTALPHYKWINSNNRVNLVKLKNVICSLI